MASCGVRQDSSVSRWKWADGAPSYELSFTGAGFSTDFHQVEEPRRVFRCFGRVFRGWASYVVLAVAAAEYGEGMGGVLHDVFPAHGCAGVAEEEAGTGGFGDVL